jgi:DNA-binding beta-propeller fold protein YncE
MPDLRDRLEERAGQLTPSTDAFDRILARAARRRRERRIASAIVALGVSATLVAGFVFSLRSDRDGRPSIDPDRTPDVSVHVPEHIGPLASLDGALWALGSDTRRPKDHYLLEIDPRNSTVLRSIRLSGAAFLTTGGGSLWITTFQNGRVLEIDPASGRVRRTIPLGHLAFAPHIAWHGGQAFVAVNDTIVRIDPGSDAAVEIAHVPSPAGLVAAFGSLWVSENSISATVIRLDPETGDVLARIPGLAPTETAGIAVGGGSVWASGQGGLLRIDPATNRVVDEFDEGGIYAYAADDRSLWIADTENVWRIDTSTGNLGRIGIGERPVGVAVVGSTLWISNAVDTVIGVPTCTPTCPDQ